MTPQSKLGELLMEQEGVLKQIPPSELAAFLETLGQEEAKANRARTLLYRRWIILLVLVPLAWLLAHLNTGVPAEFIILPLTLMFWYCVIMTVVYRVRVSTLDSHRIQAGLLRIEAALQDLKEQKNKDSAQD